MFAKIKLKLRRSNIQLSHTRGSSEQTRRDDVDMVDADFSRFSTLEKGKGKAAEPALPEEDNGLPWCASSFSYLMVP